MKKIFLPLLILLSTSCSEINNDNVNKKAYQIIVTPGHEYYTTFYTVHHDSSYIDFISYTPTDSTYVKVYGSWDVKPNPNYKK